MLYKIVDGKLELMGFDDFADMGKKEKDLENLLADNLEKLYLEDNQLMAVFQERSRQAEADLWALDRFGNLVLFELKRGIVGNDTTLQIMRYAQTHGMKSYAELNDNYCKYQKSKSEKEICSLQEAHKVYFELEEPIKEQDFNKRQKLIIVGSSSDVGLMQAVDYWKNNGLDIDFIPYRLYEINGEKYFEFFAKPYDYHVNPKNTKGIIFDTCAKYDEGNVIHMLRNKVVRAWGDASRFIRSFEKYDYVAYYHRGKGIVAVGEIVSSALNGSGDELYRRVKLLVPKKEVNCIDDLKFISPGEISNLLGKGFDYRSTAKRPYLNKKESQKVIKELKILYGEQ